MRITFCASLYMGFERTMVGTAALDLIIESLAKKIWDLGFRLHCSLFPIVHTKCMSLTVHVLRFDAYIHPVLTQFLDLSRSSRAFSGLSNPGRFSSIL